MKSINKIIKFIKLFSNLVKNLNKKLNKNNFTINSTIIFSFFNNLIFVIILITNKYINKNL